MPSLPSSDKVTDKLTKSQETVFTVFMQENNNGAGLTYNFPYL